MMSKLKLFVFLALTPATSWVFSAVSPQPRPEPNQLNNFHQVLEQVGKTVLRPGGSAATLTLQDWAHLGPGDSVLELCSGLGTGGMALAENTSCRVLLTDRDTDRLAKAKATAVEKRPSDLIETLPMDLLNADDLLDKAEHFDAIVVEASLTHFPELERERILRGLKDQTDQVLLHEICFRGEDDEENTNVSKQVGRALGIRFDPSSIEGWTELLERTGYNVTRLETGPLGVLNPINILQDEGPLGMAKIIWNVITRPDLRDRVISVRSILQKHRDKLGYIILRAVPTNIQE
ncbi:Met-10+ like-protein [Seminavis robusta]|uniref:Met-10+ like-protein n=1 Tax=Seminavis robusta TaxID=568900 RepID=A0A9N8E0D1_9STRA|nr:Met-10+ like-protein [Seminavis robusta]|eukprot:Sro425_g140090.1 Met-10+ like-protein (292) ;mRNA; f:17410-18285